MQVEVTAQARPECKSSVRHSRNPVKPLAVQKPAIEGAYLASLYLALPRSAVLSLCILVASISTFGPTLFAQTGNVVVSADTTYATGTYNLTSLTVENGATLTVGGGSTLNVTGAILVTANSNIVLQSINNSAQVNGVWAGAGVTVNTGSVEVDAGSSINADGQGYTASAGPGAGPGGSGSGGSYGGAGGSQAASTIYGSAMAPVDLGSGGGQYQGTTQPGGGAIRLIVSGTLNDNGSISANAPAVNGFIGGSAGGSVYVTAGALTGSGTFSANGGLNMTSYGSGGGGGRVAIYYNATQSTFTGFTSSTAIGGTALPAGNGGVGGAVGTVAFFDTSATNYDVMIDQDYVIPAGSNVQYNSLTVTNGATLTIGGGSTLTVASQVLVTGTSTIVLQSINTTTQVNGAWAGAGVTMTAGSVQVDAGSSINADAQGYAASAGPGAGPSGSANGGSYGGAGGGQAASTIYGSATAPTDLGSGGGQYQGTTQPGGGAVRLIVSGTLTDNGLISANGAAVSGFVGGGAGGSVYVMAGTLAGSGTFSANGGLNNTSYGSGGGGGRVAVYYNATGSSFTGFTGSTANGGTALPAGNGGVAGIVGTVAFFDTSAKNNNVAVYQNYVIPAGSNVPYNSLTVANGALLTVGGNSTLTVTGSVKVTGNSTIVLQSSNTSAQVNGAWAGVGDTINAGSIEVDAGSTINADAQGYTAGNGPGGATGTNGGSYGGAGGGQAATTVYGSETAPVDLGSGGGSYESTGGTGGGAMDLVVSGTLTNNGLISANGGTFIVCTGSGACGGGFAGGGAGGSINVSTASLAGSGTFNANGGPNASSYGNGGGGGRVIVAYNAKQSTFTGFTGSTVSGGVVPTGNGAVNGNVGTMAFFDTSAKNDDVMIDQNYVVPAGTTVQYNSLTVTNGATLTLGGGSTLAVSGAMLVTGNSAVVLQAANTTAQVNGVWAGVGDTIQAGSLEVDAGSTINADAQGYTASNGPGAGAPGTDNGGSYGGVGGGQAATTTYGSSITPVDLGSGGGSYESTGGTGGGAMKLLITGALTNNGVVSANGGTFIVCTGSGTCGGGSAGGGAGGSINVSTGTLDGDGTFNANGGPNSSSSGDGGGGGRVIVFYNATGSNFSGFTGSTVNGGVVPSNGNGAVAGAVGSLAFFDTSATNDNVAIYDNFTIPAGSSPTYNSLTVQNGALLTLGGGTTMTVADALTVNGTVVAQSSNNTAQVNGVWAGSGVSIKANSIAVNTGGSLNADSQGYVANAGPGGSPAGTSAGGSYGGLGGVGDGAAPSPIYGSEMLPVDLGSGGGSRCCGTIPGSGGGDLLLTVAATLTDDGTISANGGDGTGTQVGGGAGGSVNIHTPTLTGSGNITANGGAGGEAGGGGGRVAIYFTDATGFNLQLATATAGTSNGGNAGAVGTVYLGGAGAKVTSTTTLTASPATLPAGQAETLQAVVTAAAGGSTPTGNVTFFDGTKAIGTQALTASQSTGTAMAQLQTTTLAVGTHSITAVYAGDANVDASTSAAQTVTVSQVVTTSTLGISAATITVGQTEMLTVAIAGGTGTPALTGTVSFIDTTANTTLGTTAVTSTGTGGTAALAVSNLAVGTHVLNARYSGDANYQTSTTPNQPVVVAGKTQTITFGALPNQTYGAGPLALTATASSGLAVTYAVTGPVTLAGSTLTITGAGAVTVTASQAGNATYAAATAVAQSFTVAQAVLTVTANNASRSFGVANPAFTYATTGFVNGDTATVVGGTATLDTTATATSDAGTYPITFATKALTAANYSFNYVAGTLTVLGNAAQTITFPAIGSHAVGDPPFMLTATASSGLAITYAVTAGPATVAGNTVTLTGAGTVTIQAMQTGNLDYAAATPVSQSFTVSAAPAPTVASITPAGAVAGSAATTITLTGTNFAATDVVKAGATTLTTAYVNATTLTAMLPANLLAAAATLPISVTDTASTETSGAVNFVVSTAPAVVFTGPSTAASDQQPMVTFQLTQPYAVPINCLLTLTFAPATATGIVDPTLQFSSGGTTLAFTIPAGSTATPPVQFQTGTVAGTVTVTLTIVTADGVNVTPASVAPVVVTLPETVPEISTATIARTGAGTASALTVTMQGFSNTREVKTAVFHFTPTPGNTLTTTDLTIDVSGIFGAWFGSDASTPYGSTFTYAQPFNLNADPATIESVTVTLVNGVGDSVVQTAQ